MAKAQEMVQLAERFRETLAARGGVGVDGEVIDPEMQRELIDMGIASPVTKDTAGARYHQELSRQVHPPPSPSQYPIPYVFRNFRPYFHPRP
jgi:ESCRT-II complex subunit VPS36